MIQVRCLVENTAKTSSGFWGEHGMAWHIQTPAGQVLFDTGQSGEVLLHNAALFGLDLAQIDALALSHAHYDHTGGLPEILQHTRPGVPLYAHADLFRERFSKHGDAFESIGLRVARADLEAHSELRLSTGPVELLPGVWTTGEITDRTSFEGRSASHFIHTADGWQPDPYCDDLSLVLETGAGLVVLLGCGHAGLLNILAQVRAHFAGDIIAIAGGTHLTSATDDMLQQAVETLAATYGTPRIYPGHCSGHRATVALGSAFGDQAQPCPAGMELSFAE
ncbi:MAG: MBL fold metallo-hydrolase [Anaerolineaceae bacterium]|nr:MBL fold metallo-hydrolase [Anaerolineaceae bacterium]